MTQNVTTIEKLVGKSVRVVEIHKAHDGLVSMFHIYFENGDSITVTATGYPDGTAALDLDIDLED
jgi:hypothetical protein